MAGGSDVTLSSSDTSSTSLARPSRPCSATSPSSARCALIERTEARFGIRPERLAADTASGAAANLDWVVNAQSIAPHIPVIDKSKHEDGTFSREDFTFDKEGNVYICPTLKTLTTTGKIMNDDMLFYRANTRDC